MQDRHEDRRPASQRGLAPLAPELGSGQEGIGGDDQRTQHDARRSAIATNSGKMQATNQTVAPASIAPQSTLRPWNNRAALQIMPQATNSSAFAAPIGNGGEIDPSMLQMATEKPPIR